VLRRDSCAEEGQRGRDAESLLLARKDVLDITGPTRTLLDRAAIPYGAGDRIGFKAGR
jgi:hypothetical protein